MHYNESNNFRFINVSVVRFRYDRNCVVSGVISNIINVGICLEVNLHSTYIHVKSRLYTVTIV